MATSIGRDVLQRMITAGAQLVEVLAPKEYAAEHLPGAINIPLQQLDRETVRRRLDPERPIVVYCYDDQ